MSKKIKVKPDGLWERCIQIEQALSEECESLGGNLVHVPNYVEKQFLFWKYRELVEPTLIMKCYDEYKNEIELSQQNTKDGM